jgi:hypothetical protein
VGLLDLELEGPPSLVLAPDPVRGSPFVLGWLRDRVVFHWLSRPAEIWALSLDGKEEPIIDLSIHGICSYLAVRGGFLPYATTDGKVGVVNLVTSEDTPLPGFTRLRWAKDGLEGLSGGKGEIVVRVGP